MQIQSKSLNKIQKQAKSLHTQLIRNPVFKRTNRKRKQLRYLFQQIKSLDDNLSYTIENGKMEVLSGAGMDFRDVNSSVETRMQSLLIEWKNIDSQSFKSSPVETSDEVLKDIKRGRIMDIPRSDWYDDSDFFADNCVGMSKKAINVLAYTTVSDLNDDIDDPVAKPVAPMTVVSDIYDRIQALNNNKLIYDLLKTDMRLLTHKGAFQGANLRDLKAIKKDLFNDNGLSNSHHAVQNACVHLAKFLARHHQNIADYPIKNHVYLVKNRDIFENIVKKTRTQFLKGNLSTAYDNSTKLSLIFDNNKSAYMFYDTDELTEHVPKASQVVDILFQALNIDHRL